MFQKPHRQLTNIGHHPHPKLESSRLASPSFVNPTSLMPQTRASLLLSPPPMPEHHNPTPGTSYANPTAKPCLRKGHHKKKNTKHSLPSSPLPPRELRQPGSCFPPWHSDYTHSRDGESLGKCPLPSIALKDELPPSASTVVEFWAKERPEQSGWWRPHWVSRPLVWGESWEGTVGAHGKHMDCN